MINREPHIIIAIGRQYGSGGRRIGRRIAKRLGIDYYDSELLSVAAERLGLSKEIFARHDEKAPSSMKTLFQGALGLGDGFHDIGISGESVYAAQSEVIREISDKGSCVIVGRTADYILRDYPGLVSIFFHAPLEVRAMNILKRGEASTFKDALSLARRLDHERENYYNFYIGRKLWGKAHNYSLCFDSSLLSEEGISELVAAYVEQKQKNQR